MATIKSKKVDPLFADEVRDPYEGVAIISTSDRSTFRTCRRRWNWSSHLRAGLRPIAQAAPLWVGSGLHHFLEDYHGARVYASSDAAIDDYVQATKKAYGADALPDSFADDVELMRGMAAHYVQWLTKRDPFKTYQVKGEPQVEVSFEFELPLKPDVLKRSGFKRAIYKGTLDRVVEDENGYLWIVDYKTAAQLTSTEHLELDSQIGTYLWAARYIYRKPVMGFIYTQLLKAVPKEPRVLKNGSLSTDKSQRTTHAMYRAEAVRICGPDSSRWPEEVRTLCNVLASNEGDDDDGFIRRTRVARSEESLEIEAMKILAEVTDMLDPALKLYPSPDFTCYSIKKCPYMEACISFDRGEDYMAILEGEFAKVEYAERNSWREHLKLGRHAEKPVVMVAGKTLSKKR